MIGLVLSRAFEEYRENFLITVSFSILFVFLAAFSVFSGFFFSSGSVFLSYDFSLLAIIGIVAGIVFLYIYSFFVAITIYSIKRDVQHFSLDDYWNSLMRTSALKIFVLYAVLSILFYLLSVGGFIFGLSPLALFLCLLISIALMYAPQSMVLDESTLPEAAGESIAFWFANPSTSLAIIVVGSVILAAIVWIEYMLEIVSIPGMAISFILTVLFLVPFFEQMKSYAFVMKYELIKRPEMHQAGIRPHLPKIKYGTRLRQNHPGGKL